MASRFDHKYSSRPGYYDSGYSHPTSESYPHRSHSRTQSEYDSQSNYSRTPAYNQRGKPRSNTLSAFVEDESTALAREHNPGKNHGPTTAAGDIQFPGEIDQVPILIEVEENPERRFVFIPGAAEALSEASNKSSGTGLRTNKASSSHQEASTSIADNSTASSVNVSIVSDATPSSSLSTPPSSADGVANGHTRPEARDNSPGYEANPCRKFVFVPRTDTEPVTSEPSTSASEADYPADHRRRTKLEESDSNSRLDKDGGKLGVAAAAAAAAAAGAALAGSSKNEPEIKRRRSRVDLPRLDTDVDQQSRRNAASNSGRPRTASQSDRRLQDRANSEQGGRNRVGDRTDRRDNDFLSPAFTKHSTSGRDRAYFDQNTASASATTGPSHRTRSRDAYSSLDDGRPYGHGRASFSAEPDYKRRANSFSDNDKSNSSAYKRPSRDEIAGSRDDRRSPSPRPKSRSPPSPHPRTERRLPSPSGTRDRDRERERERERDRAEREREREREREEERQRERRREKDSERDSEREQEKERMRRGIDTDRTDRTDRDRQRPARRDSVHRKRRDSVAREDEVYSSDERSKLGATANTSLRRRNSERRRPANADFESVVSKTSSNPDPSRPSGSSDASTNGRLKPTGTTPLATPKSSQTQFPFISGSPPKALFEPRPPSPTKSYREERRAKDERRAESPSPPSSSPESRSRISEGDRPRGPRPRAHAPNVVHNPTSSSSSLPTLPHLAVQPRSSSFPVPIPTPVPIPMPSRGSVYMRDEGEGRRERRRSPVDTSRGYSSFSGNPARVSGVFVPPPSTSQTPTGRQPPAFYINVPGSAVPDTDYPPDRSPEVPAKGSDSGRTDLPLVPIYQRYAEDVYHGRIKGLPECPRQSFSTRYRDWRTLAPFRDFYVCPRCYDSAFAHTRYADDFVPAPPVDPSEKTRCTFGSMYWYRVAFFFIEAYKKPNLNLLRAMFDKDETLRLPCSGPNRVMGRWFTIQDPITARAITRFSTCEQCATAIQILFPRLKGLFQDNDPSRFDTTNICALYFEPDRKRLWKYIDVFETTHNEAVSTNRPVDVNNFVNKLLDIGYYDECRRDIPVRGRKWYWMRSVPDFVVCQECFQEAVFPQVNNYRTVAGDFFKEPKELPLGACHLYSPRMRDIFLKACHNSDTEYLMKNLRERDEIATDITNRIHRLPPTVTTEDIEHRLLIAEWRKWE